GIRDFHVTGVQTCALPISGRLRLLGNYPNPFNRSTQIRYAVDEPVHVTLRIYDLLGRELATLVDAHRTGGIHNVTFDAQDLPSRSEERRVGKECTSARAVW